jgi:D-beta-D-heptose 7-phosphate kinase/D-beta-D-heptose 1-phosphate adenosyltransferase
VKYLEAAKAGADILVVAVNSDDSVKKIKGKLRPINRESDRAKILAALACVDYVTIFNETTPLKVIQALKPDILVKGGDWDRYNIVGANFIASYGGKVKIIPFVKDYSTTGILKKIAQRFK